MLQILWQDMRTKADLHYRLPEEQYNKVTQALEDDHDLQDLKTLLIELLDKNMLYVPYSEIDDTTYTATDEDKRLNQRFYGK